MFFPGTYVPGYLYSAAARRHTASCPTFLQNSRAKALHLFFVTEQDRGRRL